MVIAARYLCGVGIKPETAAAVMISSGDESGGGVMVCSVKVMRISV